MVKLPGVCNMNWKKIMRIILTLKPRTSAESVFSVQTSVNDFASGNNGNYGDVLNFPQNGGPGGCCGFFQPSQWLVNHFKTDPATGLPDLDHFNDKNVKNDEGYESDSAIYTLYRNS